MFKLKKAGGRGSGWKRYNIPSIVVVGILAFLGIILACFVHVRLIRDNLKDVISDQYESQLQVAEKAMGDRMRDIEINIGKASTEIEVKIQKQYSDSQIIQVLAKYATSEDIRNMAYISPEGTALLNTGDSKDISAYADALKEKRERRFLVTEYDGADGKEALLVYFVPVTVDGQDRGVVIATQDCSHMLDSEAFSSLKSIGSVYVLDRDAHILTSSYNQKDLRDAYDSLYDLLSGEYHLTDKSIQNAKTALKAPMADGETVKCVKNDGTGFYLAYVMVSGYEDVMVALAYTDDAFHMSESSVIGSTVVTVVIIIALMLLLLVVELLSSARANRMIERFAFVDEITGGKNLNYFKREATEILKKYKGMAFSVHRFDIANFRYINEAYGHEKADQLLKAITEEAERIFSSNEICVRMNADQYVLLTKNTLDLEERLFVFTDKVNARALDIGIRYPIKFKRGVYKIQDTTEDISIIIDKANAARKELNGEEKESVAIYSDKMVRDMRKVDKIESSMEQALFNGEFKLFIQPKWDIVENHLYGGEALVRWIRDDGTMVYPSDFIPIFEKNGFIEQLDMFMLESSCQLIRQLVDAGKPVYPISVNQSRVLLHNPQYLDKVKEVMRRYDIPRRSIELEVTETVLFMDQEKMLSIMNNLKSEDIPLSMDDFGSGYSSLNMLKDFPFDVLKIDKEFFSESITSEASILILTKIVEMAHGLGIKVICEGVETKDQVEILKKIGVRYVQGYYYSRPIPGARFLEQFCELDIFSAESQAKARENEEKARELVAAETERSAKIHGNAADEKEADEKDADVAQTEDDKDVDVKAADSENQRNEEQP